MTTGELVQFEFKLHDKVTVKELQRPGIIDDMISECRGLMYRVVFWSEGTRKSEWVYASEIELRQ